MRTQWKTLDYLVFLLLLPFVVPARAILLATFFVTWIPIRVGAALRRQPYLYFVQDIESKYDGLTGRVLNALCNLSYSDRHILAANSYLGRRLLKDFGTDCAHVDIGPDDRFLDEQPLAEKTYDVVYFLRREPWKGLNRFIELVDLVKCRISFLCLSQDETLFEVVSQPGVTCVRPRNDVELIRLMDSARIFLLTSTREGFALPPLEAMARGIPPILFPCGGPDIYIEPGRNAVYVDSATEAYHAIDRLLRDDVALARMAEHGRRTAARYRMSIALDAIASTLEAAANCVR